MGLFGRKKKEQEEVPEEPLVDGGWRSYAKRASEKIEAGDMGSAIDNWCEAVDRFDEAEDDRRYLARMLDGAVKSISDLAHRRAMGGDESLTNLVQEIDVEFALKHPDMPERSLTEEVYERLVAKIPSSATPDEAVMLASAASYCVMGYMRRAPDIRHVRKKCVDAADMCAESAEAIRNMPRGKRSAGRIKPKYCLRYAEAFSAMFRRYAEEIDAATVGMDAGDLDRIRDAWTSFPDRYVQVREALTESYQLALAGSFSRGKRTRMRDAAIQSYVADFVAGTDPMRRDGDQDFDGSEKE